MLAPLLLLAAAAGMPATGPARVAIVSSSDLASGQAPLRYAGLDAQRVSAVLRELGGFAVTVELRNPGAAAVRRAFDEVERLAASRPGIELLFYYSGHADTQGLLLGEERFPFAELRRRIESSRATVRVALLDACHSGQAIRPKGGQPGPAYSLQSLAPMDLRGAAIIAASRATELAQESSDIEGSYFTHHMLSALRGAADQDGNGLVTLNEAYRYTYSRTIAATVPSMFGTQHPSYDYELAGSGEFVMTRVSAGRSGMLLPASRAATFFVQNAAHEIVAEVMAEADGGRHVRIALRPGRYRVVALENGATYAGEVRVPESGDVIVERSLLRETERRLALSKGGSPGRNELMAELALAGATGSMLSSAGEVGLVYYRRGLRWSYGPHVIYGHSRTTVPSFDLVLDRVRLTIDAVRRIPLAGWELQLGSGVGATLIHESLVERSGTSASLSSSDAATGLTGMVSMALEVPVQPWLPLRLGWAGTVDLIRVDGSLRFLPELRASISSGWRF